MARQDKVGWICHQEKTSRGPECAQWFPLLRRLDENFARIRASTSGGGGDSNNPYSLLLHLSPSLQCFKCFNYLAEAQWLVGPKEAWLARLVLTNPTSSIHWEHSKYSRSTETILNITDRQELISLAHILSNPTILLLLESTGIIRDICSELKVDLTPSVNFTRAELLAVDV